MTSGTNNSAISDQKHNNCKDVDDVLSTIDAKLNCNKEHAISEALEDFKLVLHKYNENIPIKIFKWTKKTCNVEITALLTKKLQEQIARIVDSDGVSIKLITIVPGSDTEINEFIIQLLMEAIEALSDETIKNLLCSFVIPEMFNAAHRDEEGHDVLIDFGFQLIVRCPITKLNVQEVKLFISQLIDQYIKVLEKWREENYSRWHKLWMFLVRFSAKQLHSSVDVANKLLRVVEYAFRNSSYEQRLKGYECWKEQIDNASLDIKHFCSSKQIRLLVTPLRAKFSKMEIVICKRFEVFLYLLEKLQGNSVLCLNEFLEFCFGVSNTNLSSKNGQGKLVPNLWLRSIQVFLAILGDQTHISAELNRTIFEKQIIDENNIGRFDQVIIYSVIESSTILKDISSNDADKISIFKSLWRTLFSILMKATQEIQDRCFQTISNSLSALLKDYNEDVTYLSLLSAFADLLDSTIDYRLYSDSFKLLIEHSITFLNEEAISEDLLDQFESPFLKICKDRRMFEFLTEQLKKLHPTKNEVVTYEVWKVLGLKMINNHQDEKSAAAILSWPVFHLQKFSMLSDDLCSKWTELFTQTTSPNRIFTVNEIDKIFKSNPLLSSNTSSLIHSLGKEEMSLEEDLIEPLLKLMASIMSLPLLSHESAEKLFLLILKCTKMFAASDNTNLENVECICQCLSKVPAHLKDSILLETLEKLVRKIVPYANTTAGKKLRNIMTTFSSTTLQKKALKISTLLSPDTNISPGGNVKRSIRMTQMVFEKNGSTANKDKVNALQLFGKDVETLTPIKVKGSILQNTPSSSSRSKRIVNSVKKLHTPNPPILEDHTSDFVVINTEVKLQKDMLTDHQKEKLKQRREDIPALYQDLSQSQTQSSLSTDTQSNHIPQVAVKNQENEVPPTCEEMETSSSFTDQNLEIPTEEKAIIKTIEQLKKQEEVDSNTDSSDESGIKKSKKNTPQRERELMRIQMDIVGGNSFIQNLPSKRPRKINEKVSAVAPKKSKKIEPETQSTENTQNLSGDPIKANKNSPPEESSKQSEDKKLLDEVPSKKSNTLKTSQVSPVVIIENIPSGDMSSNELSQTSVSEGTPNRRKKQLMKPVKNFDSPSSEKKKNKSMNKETPSEKKKKKEGGEKRGRKPKSPIKNEASETPQSEILFASEINEPVEAKSPTSNQQSKDKTKKISKPGTSGKSTQLSSEEISVKVKEEDLVLKNTPSKPKKTPKELMKKNKEKVKTIQSQLKLANLSDLEGSSEKNKPKNAKLIFIRELTNTKNSQDTKVSPAGLKRNKDNKSKSIAYAIETPATSVTISSLDLDIDDMQPPSTSKSQKLKDATGSLKAKPARKRKRSQSVGENSFSTDSSPESQRKGKILKLNESFTDEEVREIIGVSTPPSVGKTNVEEKTSTIMEANTSTESLHFSPESPSRSTRSRTNSPVKRIKDSPQSQEKSKGVKSLFKESEDIIESSQGSFIENSTVSIGSMSKSKIKQSPKLHNTSVKSQESPKLHNTSVKSEESEKQETVVPPEMPCVSEPSPEVSVNEKSPDTKSEKPISQADTLTCESNYEAQQPVVQVEVPEKHELSDSEKLLSMADTVSIESCVTEEMTKNVDKSPVTDISCNVSDKTSEISDIVIVKKNDDKPSSSVSNESKPSSPISIELTIDSFGTPQKNNENLPGSPVSQATPTFKQELLDNTLDISPICSQTIDTNSDILEALEAAIGETSSNIAEVEEVASTAKPPEENKIVMPSSNERSNKLVNMVNVESPVSSLKKTSKRKTASPMHMKSRYEKLFSMCANKENGDEVKENGSSAGTETVEDILTFTREVPSPLAVPSSSILKRKLADTEDSYSPCPKRKRVNFSYPCITSTKLFIRHKDELNTHYKPTFGANLFDDDPKEEDSEEEDPFADPEAYRTPSEEITNSLSLYSNKPIDARLADCQDSLDSLWKRLTNPMYSNKLKRLLKSKHIETVGDLASLNEVDINRLPFKDPKVKTVRKALFYYYNNTSRKSNDKEQNGSTDASSASSSASSEEEQEKKEDLGNQELVQVEECSKAVEEEEIPPPLSLKEEFRSVLLRMKERKTSLEEFGEVLLDLVEESELINLLEAVYNTNFRKFFGKPHWRYLVENIVKSGGTAELFDIISDLAENNKVFSDQLEHIVQIRIDRDPLKNILKKKTLVQLNSALQDCIQEGEFQRENVLQTCLMPLIKSPSDIRNYFNSLTIVQIHDLFIERVQLSDLTCFLDQIKEHYGNYTIAQCANKKDVLKICSKEELATSLIEKENEVGAVKHLVSYISNSNKLLELYNYIGTLLPLKLRVESHIDLLKNIPFDKDEIK